MQKIRKASHAGSWYTNDAKKLQEELEGWLAKAGLAKSANVRGVIAPHAGYSYSGRAAAYAFGNIDPTTFHGCFFLVLLIITILQNVPLPKFQLIAHLWVTFQSTLKSTRSYMPLGNLNLWIFMLMKQNIAWRCICHILPRFLPLGFQVQLHIPQQGTWSNSQINRSIGPYGNGNHRTCDPEAFKAYLKEFDNTICGRHPISVFLHMLKNCSTKIAIKFLRYEQSSQCKSMRDSSVSYAFAAANLDD